MEEEGASITDSHPAPLRAHLNLNRLDTLEKNVV